MIAIDISNEQQSLPIDEDLIARAARLVLSEAKIEAGSLSIAIVDDPTIHELNRRYLHHDYPTDVLSFLLEQDDERLEGEVIVSADTAVRTAAQWSWPAEHEILLYVVHGVLHLVGFEDTTDPQRLQMREAERRALQQLGISLPADAAAS